MRLPTKITAAVVAAVCAGGLLSACGATETLTAHQKLTQAEHRLSKAKAVSLTLTMHATASQLAALDSDSHVTADDKEGAAALAEASLTLTLSSPDGIDHGSIDTENAALTLNVAGKPAAELRLADKALYLHADATGIEKLANTVSPGAGDSLAAALAHGPSSGEPAFVDSLAQGRWLEIGPKYISPALDKLAKAAAKQAKPSQKDKTTLLQVLRGDVTMRDDGTDSTGDKLTLTANARKIVTDLTQALGTTGLGAGNGLDSGTLSQLTGKQLRSIPNRRMSVNLWIRDGDLVAVQVDAAKLAGKAGIGQVPIRIDIDDHADAVTAPAGALPLDPKAALTSLGLYGLASGILGQSTGFGSGLGGA